MTKHQKLIKKIFVVPLALLGFFSLFPGFSLLLSALDKPSEYHECSAVSIESTSTIAVISLMTTFALYLLFVFKLSKDALLFKLFTVIALTSMGWWFFITSYTIAACQSNSISKHNLDFLVAVTLYVSVAIFLLYLKRKLDLVLSINTNAFDFDNNTYRHLAILKRPDGISISKANKLFFSSSIIGVFAYQIINNYTGSFSGIAAQDILGFLCMWFAGYALLGYLAIGELYITWKIHCHNKANNQRMIVEELT